MKRFALIGLFTVLVFASAHAAAPGPVYVDQVGYTPTEEKWVAVAGPAAGFNVLRVSNNALVFSGSLVLRRAADPASGDDVYAGDFTALATPGIYRIHVPGVGYSAPFLIGAAVYDDLYRDLLKGLFYERCGYAITAPYGGAYTHDACHDEDGGIASYDWATTGGAPGGYRNTIGGWHDAGDYGKYMTNNAYAVGILLQAYEQFPPRYAHDDAGIPESGNGVPDILDEARWSLEWMLEMQLANGSVLHRDAVKDFSAEVLPENDTETRYYTGVSSDATAHHAAAMALAARVFAPFDAGFAAACSTSATAAWAWLVANPGRVPVGGFVNLYDHHSATYVGGDDLGHRVWAAAEIYRLNGTASAKSYLDAHWGSAAAFDGVWYPDGWAAAQNMGAFTYRDTPGATASVVSGNWWSIENSTLSSCAGWSARVDGDGYACAAATDGTFGDYYWGFTGVLLRYAWTLLQAYRYSGDPAYEEAAREQIHYILGRNPVGKVFVTGLGTNPVLHSHGAWNLAAGYVDVDDALCHPVPFWLVGGTNAQGNGSISPYMGKCYEDIADPDYYNAGNWTLNETSINIQAAFIVLAGYFSTGGTATAVPDLPVASGWTLLPASPNPFAASTELRWSGAPGGLRLLDVSGRLVRSWNLTPAEAQAGGLRWDGRDAAGLPLPSGVFYLRAGDSGESVKLVKRR